MTLGGFTAGDVRYVVRRARRDDLAELVAMLADDPLGAGREHAPAEAYGEAFERIDADPNQCSSA